MYIILINNKLRINIAEIKTEKEVQDLINNRSDLDYLLQIAMSQKNKFLVKALIKKGANVNYYGNLSYVIEEIRCSFLKAKGNRTSICNFKARLYPQVCVLAPFFG